MLREVDRVFSTYRADSVISRLGRGEITRRRLPARGRRGPRRSASGPGASPAAPSTYAGPGRTADGPRPQRGGQGLGRRARRAGPARPAATPTSACPRAATWSAGRAARRAARLADRHRGPARPDPAWSPSSRSATARSPPPARPTAAPTSSTPAPARARRVASVTVVDRDLTWADIDATAAYALGRRRPRLAAHPARPHRRSWSGPTAPAKCSARPAERSADAGLVALRVVHHRVADGGRAGRRATPGARPGPPRATSAATVSSTVTRQNTVRPTTGRVADSGCSASTLGGDDTRRGADQIGRRRPAAATA